MALRALFSYLIQRREKKEYELLTTAFQELAHFSAYICIQRTRFGAEMVSKDYDACKREYFNIRNCIPKGRRRKPLIKLIKKLKMLKKRRLF